MWRPGDRVGAFGAKVRKRRVQINMMGNDHGAIHPVLFPAITDVDVETGGSGRCIWGKSEKTKGADKHDG
jgi:hypothetical protein